MSAGMTLAVEQDVKLQQYPTHENIQIVIFFVSLIISAPRFKKK